VPNKSAIERANQNWGMQTPLLDHAGNPLPPSSSRNQGAANASFGGGSGGYGGGPTGGSNSGDNPMSEIAGLKKNVGFLNWAIAFMFAGAFILAWVVDQRAEGRDDKSGQKVEKIADKVEDLKVSSAEQRSDLKAILEKLNER
jgi:hypothetical protein